MGRVRLSTTVDAELLAQARVLVPGKDAELLDLALAAIVRQRRTAREVEILRNSPYRIDEQLDAIPAAPDFDELPFDLPVPPAIVELARARRRTSA